MRSGQDRKLVTTGFCSNAVAIPSRFPRLLPLGPELLPSTLAGAEGFEPPSSVLETDSLTVELTPLKQMQTSLPTPKRVSRMTASRTKEPEEANKSVFGPKKLNYLVSLCGVCLRQRLQNFENSRRPVVV